MLSAKIVGHLGALELSSSSPTMIPKFQQHGGAHSAEHPPHGPYWKRMHHSPFFWVAFVFLMAGMIVYVVTNNLAFWPGEKAQQPVPALMP